MTLTPDDARFLEVMKDDYKSNRQDTVAKDIHRLLRIVEGLRERLKCSECGGIDLVCAKGWQKERDALKKEVEWLKEALGKERAYVNQDIRGGYALADMKQAQLESAIKKHDAIKAQFANVHVQLSNATGCATDGMNWEKMLSALKSKLADAEARIKKAFQIIEGCYKSPLSGKFACGTGCDMGAAGPGPDGQHDPDCRIKALYELLKEMEAKRLGARRS